MHSNNRLTRRQVASYAALRRMEISVRRAAQSRGYHGDPLRPINAKHCGTFLQQLDAIDAHLDVPTELKSSTSWEWTRAAVLMEPPQLIGEVLHEAGPLPAEPQSPGYVPAIIRRSRGGRQ